MKTHFQHLSLVRLGPCQSLSLLFPPSLSATLWSSWSASNSHLPCSDDRGWLQLFYVVLYEYSTPALLLLPSIYTNTQPPPHLPGPESGFGSLQGRRHRLNLRPRARCGSADGWMDGWVGG
ncbi:hypothetical protein LY76DRAFT_267914 [Colletotrichum caudatum]|nr:hypothetical protein LY76DRAFT_267914 [Colletotrichum caudatum]